MRLIDADALKELFEKLADDPWNANANTTWSKAYEYAAEYVEEQPTVDVPDTNVGDTISRQAAIDALDKRFDDIPMEQTEEILMLRKDLRDLPSAQRWIPATERLHDQFGRVTMAVNALQGSDECAECAIDPEKPMRDKILESFAQCDFVHVTRCKDCRWYKPATKLSKSWCERYDEPREAAGYCSHAVPKEV